MKGFIKLYRRSLTDKRFSKEIKCRWSAWTMLLLMASYKETEDISPGQIKTNCIELAKQFNWNRFKVRRFLSWLHREKMILLETNNEGILITITDKDWITPLAQVKRRNADQAQVEKRNTKPNKSIEAEKIVNIEEEKEIANIKEEKEIVQGAGLPSMELVKRFGKDAAYLLTLNSIENLIPDPDRRALFEKWIEYLREIGRPVRSHTQLVTLVKLFNEHSFNDLKEMSDYSIAFGYSALYPERLEQIKNSKEFGRNGRPDYRQFW